MVFNINNIFLVGVMCLLQKTYSLSPQSTSKLSSARPSSSTLPLLPRRSVLPAAVTGVISGCILPSLIIPSSQNNHILANAETTGTNFVPGIPSTKNAAQVVIDGGSSWATVVSSSLGKSRILSNELSPLQSSLNPFADQELFYPSYFLGSWNVKATLKRKVYPYGTAFVPIRSLLEGSPKNRQESVGDSTTYQLQYFVDKKNNKILADRPFNIISMTSAYQQLTPVKEVMWDYQKDPTRLTLNFGAGPLADDMRPLGQRRGEIYVTAHQSENYSDTKFCAAERTRQVTLAPGNVIVSDSETITEFTFVDDDTKNHIKAISRIAVYLTPNPNSREGILWQQVAGKAVAFFDYELDMHRKS